MFSRWAIALAFCVSSIGICSDAAPVDDSMARPNVLFIMSDDQGTDSSVPCVIA